mgnify:CR=1 FL=1
MTEDLKKVIETSTFEIVEGDFIYAKVKELPSAQNMFMVSKDKDEITVVAKQEEIESLEIIERNKDTYSLIALNISLPFYAVGFLAAVTSAIASADMNILVVSTYSKDYILVRKEYLDKAKDILLSLGLKSL